jgi:ribonuclease D
MASLDLIDSEKSLVALCDELNKCNWFALDTEFVREKTYYPKLCLIQVATPDVIACIDALALKSLSPLINILYGSGTTKVFHAAYQDLEILFYLCGRIPRPIFDTQLAASLLGYGDQIGYASLVKETLGTTLDKAHTRTDWSIRPLNPLQLRYAADDVRYLRQLYLDFSSRLIELNRLQWLYEDTEHLFNENVFKGSLDDAWKRVRGANRLTPKQLSVLHALAAWREHRAMKSNRPRRWILSDVTLLNLARHAPADLASLATIQGMPQKFCKRHGDSLVDAIRVASNTPRDCWPVAYSRRASSSKQEALAEQMMAVVRQQAEDLNISPNTLAGRTQLLKLAMGERDLSAMKGWRFEIIGKPLQELMDKGGEA